MKNPYIEIACREFITGTWWWATVDTKSFYITSGYCRSRAVAVRKLKRELLKLENVISFANGFLRNQSE